MDAGPAGAPGRARSLRPGPAWLWLVGAGVAYLVLAVVIWWHVWSTHPSATTTCECGDPSLFLWFLEWPAYALTHGHSPLFSRALFHPEGVNMLANTSVLAIGIPLVPVTLLFGPVASLNVADTLAPALSALAAYWAFTHWVRWRPAAFFGGLLYGFSPFELGNDVYSHLMTATLVVPPLVLVALDELLVRQRRRPLWTGIALGLLLVVEFFVSTEMLVITVMTSLAGVLLLVLYRLVTDPGDLLRRARRALPGVGAAAGVVGVLLAYPAWFALAGPAHLSGPIWSNIAELGGYTPGAFVDPTAGTTPNILLLIGGYLGAPLPSASLVGAGLLAVLAVGLLVWWRERALWLFAAVAVLCAVLSLGGSDEGFAPWRLVAKLPLLDNLIQQRFVAVMYLALAAMLALVLDRAHRARIPVAALRERLERVGRRAGRFVADRALPTALALGLAAGALVPLVSVFAPRLPFETTAVTVPPWFSGPGSRLAAGQVVLVYPTPFSGIQLAEAWQAVVHPSFAQAGGGGPQGTAARAGAERPGFVVLEDLSFGFVDAPTGTPAQLAAVRQALAGWGVTMVVIPRLPSSLPLVMRGHDPVFAAAFMTAALGRRPRFVDDAWVWTSVRRPPPALRLLAGTIGACTAKAERLGAGPRAAPACVLTAARTPR